MKRLILLAGLSILAAFLVAPALLARSSGNYFSGARVHSMLLRKSILDPERGTVEAWYRQASDPVPYEHNPHRIFGGPYSLTGVDEVQLFSQDRLDNGDPRLHFSVFFGDEPPPGELAHVVPARSLVDGRQGYPISALNGTWLHVAGVWDRGGIAGSEDTVRLYVNGEVVAASRASDWGTTPCVNRRPGGQWRCFADVAGCNDTCANVFAVDNLKLWDYAKTDFGDRFEEGSTSDRGLLLWNKLGSPDEVRNSAFGPPLAFFDCHDPTTPYFLRRCAYDISGALAYVPGVFGRAAGVTNTPPVCTVPNLRGLKLQAARRSLTRARCRAGRTVHAYSRRVRRGRVSAQRPRPRTVLGRGSRVTLVVSLGPRRS